MKITEIYTPAIIVDLDIMDKNLKRYCDAAKAKGKQVWPMVKTHKSLELAKAQMAAGCTGLLCGTLDEAELYADNGFTNIMYAYPVSTEPSLSRVVEIAKKTTFISRIDGREAAEALNAAAGKAGIKINYTIIVDAGLHRFGIDPKTAGSFAKSLSDLENLLFKGISTHPGHVYAASCEAEVPNYIAEERNTAKTAVEALKAEGFTCELVTSGSTPTFFGACEDEYLNVLHPGNYIFNDAIQLSTNTATEDECALYIYAAVISHPSEDLYIIDAGAKCFGLDQGAHGNSSIVGYGHVIGHPELTVDGLSEEVGKLHTHGETTLKVGDKIKVIPNHSCSSANLTSYYIGIRNEEVDHAISVDVRSNSTKKNIG